MRSLSRFRALAAAALLTLCAAAAAPAQTSLVVRISTSTWDVANSTRQMHRVAWRQGETVQCDYLLSRAGATMDLSLTNLVVLWDVYALTNFTAAALSQTGTIVVATNGHIRLQLTPAQSDLQTNTYYGFVRAAEMSGTNTSNMGVLVPQVIEVLFSP